MSDLENKVHRLIRPEVLASGAYSVLDAHGMIKLDAMESPFSWPPAIKQGWLEVLRNVEVNRYPDTDPQRLKQRLADAMGVPSDMAVLLGNGSDELIQIMLLALARPEACVLAPVPTFVMYEVIAKAVGMDFVGVPLGPDFALDAAATGEAIERYQPAVIFIAYPNNPTGNLFAADIVEGIIRQAKGLVVIDEAYFAFTDTSFMDYLARYDNLLVLRTVSKMGLAGLRLGLLAGAPCWLTEFNKVRLPYNVNSLTQASIEFAVVNREFFDRQTAQIRAERARLYEELASISKVQVWASETNFILFRIHDRDATQVFERLCAAGVLVKNLDRSGGTLRGCLRVTVGTAQENDAFLAALKRAISV
ncbi:MAG: histidinol-phosphate transaminase [Acidiferrobacterales bacterium]